MNSNQPLMSTTASRVLVVDDSEEQVRLLLRVLTSSGYECRAVANGNQAFDACVSFVPDVVLLDVHLPGADGLTVCRRLKLAPETRFTPILIMTGHAGQDAYLQALEAGADDFLAKPIMLAELRARVRSAARMKRYIDELDDAAASIVMLGATIEARDRLTDGHCQRMAQYASRLGAQIGLGQDDLTALERGGYLHDLGKIAVPDAVLFKAGPLTAAEYALVKTHPVVGERLCSPLRTLHRVRPIIRSHHETLDGQGYPDGLVGSQVPLLAQVIAVADVFDALTSDRPYRRALAPAIACDILLWDVALGKRDGELVREFITLVSASAEPTAPAWPEPPRLKAEMHAPGAGAKQCA
jgi:putative two-component system response regulator